jgi:hypothetical protein
MKKQQKTKFFKSNFRKLACFASLNWPICHQGFSVSPHLVPFSPINPPCSNQFVPFSIDTMLAFNLEYLAVVNKKLAQNVH